MSDNYTEIVANVEFLAENFKCDIRTVQNYAVAGMPRNERGEYPLFACLIWRIQKLMIDNDTLAKENPLKLAQKEAIDLNNERKKLDLAKQRGDLLDRELIEQINVSTIKMIGRNIDALAPRLNKILGGDATTLAQIKKQTDELRNLCADTSFNYFEEEENINTNDVEDKI